MERHPIFIDRKSDIVIFNKYTFGLHPHFWHRAPKTLGISKVKRVIRVFYYVNEVTLR